MVAKTESHPIPGFPAYSVTQDGRVWSQKYTRGRWLKPGTTRGHLFVILMVGGKKKMMQVHRLVWTTFKGPIPKGFEIDHIDRDHTNNNLSNIRLVTQSQNALNRGKRRSNTSGFKGVSQLRWQAEKGWASWYGRVMLNGRVHHTGYFYTPGEAAAALRELRERVCGEFAYHE